MKDKLLKNLKSLMLIVPVFTFLALLSYQPDAVAEAAEKKPSIAKSMTIPIGKLDAKSQWNKDYYEIEKAQKLTVNNKIKGATYTFKSGNTKVVTVSKDGGYLTGIKEGTATITCTQTYNNKTTTVGTCKVTVKKAALKLNEYADTEYGIGTYGYGLYEYYADLEPIFHIEYRNPKATYSFTSDSKNFTIKEIKYDASSAGKITKNEAFKEELEAYIGDRYFYGYEFTAKRAGTYKVTVKETYNKKTTTLGSFKVIIKDTHVTLTDVDMLLGEYFNVNYLLRYPKPDKTYYYIIENYDKVIENNTLIMNQDEDDVILYANKAGKAKVSVREGSENGTLIGTINFVVSEIRCNEIIPQDNEYTTYEGDEYFYIYFELEPWNTTDKVTITSDNPDVIKVTYNEEEYSWYYKVGKAGKATVTIKCGDKSVAIPVTVEAEEADEYNY